MKTALFTKTNLLLFLFYTNISYSQNSFIFTIKENLWDNIPTNCISLSNGGFILTTVIQHIDTFTMNTFTRKVELIKLNKQGQMINIKDIDYQGRNCAIANFVQVNSNEFIGCGYIIDTDNSYKLWLFKIDSSLNEIQNKVLSLGHYNYYYIKCKIDHNGNVLCFGNVQDTIIQISVRLFIGKFSETLDSIHTKIFGLGLGEFDLLEKPDYSGYYFFVSGYNSIATGQVLKMDTSFILKSVDSIPRKVTSPLNAFLINPNKIYLTGEKIWSNNTRYIGALILDTQYSVIHQNFLGKLDTITFPGFYKNLDYYYNIAYIGGTLNFYQSEFAQGYCWYYLNKVDTTLDIKWQKYFGGDANYTLYGVLATPDSGCLMYGTRYDWNTQINERDIYVIKVNKDGLILSAGGTISEKVKEAILFPNPATDKIYVRTALRGLTLSLFDVNGRYVMNEEIQSMSDQFDISNLVSGIYFYRFTKDEKMIDSGKLIKQ